MSSLARFLGIIALSLIICPVYMFLSLAILKGIFYLKTVPWTKLPPQNILFQWSQAYFNELKDVESQMLYLSIILVIISCVIVLIIFWNEVEKENETELEMEKNNKIVKTGEVLTEKQVSKSKRNKKE